MSRLRKERKRQQKSKFIMLVLAVVVGVLGLAAYLVYDRFFKREPLEVFFPEKPIFFAKIDLTPSIMEGQALLKISENFEDREFFTKAVTNFIFGDIRKEQVKIEPTDFTAWIGNEISFGNINLSQLENMPVMVVHVKNQVKAEEFLKKMLDNLRVKGNAVGEESFREQNIVQVRGNDTIAYSFDRDYLLISRESSGIKKMLDLELGAEKNLADNSDFKKTRRILKGNQAVVFAYFDLVALTTTMLHSLDLGGADFWQKIGSAANAPTGLVLVPDEKGFKIKIFAKSDSAESQKNNFKSKLTKEVPNDLVFYLEGKDLSSFIEGLLVGEEKNPENFKAKAEGIKRAIELQFGFNVDRDLLELVKGQYALTLLRDRENNKPNLALILEVEKEKEAAEKMKKLEDLLVSALKNYRKDEFNAETRFTEHQTNDLKFRYLNLPDKYNFDLNYAVLDKKIILTTTETALKNILEKKKNKEVLAENYLFKRNLDKINLSTSKQLYYLEPQALFKFIDEFTKFDYGYLSDEMRLLESFGVKSHRSDDGLVLEGYLELKKK